MSASTVALHSKPAGCWLSLLSRAVSITNPRRPDRPALSQPGPTIPAAAGPTGPPRPHPTGTGSGAASTACFTSVVRAGTRPPTSSSTRGGTPSSRPPSSEPQPIDECTRRSSSPGRTDWSGPQGRRALLRRCVHCRGRAGRRRRPDEQRRLLGQRGHGRRRGAAVRRARVPRQVRTLPADGDLPDGRCRRARARWRDGHPHPRLRPDLRPDPVDGRHHRRGYGAQRQRGVDPDCSGRCGAAAAGTSAWSPRSGSPRFRRRSSVSSG